MSPQTVAYVRLAPSTYYGYPKGMTRLLLITACGVGLLATAYVVTAESISVEEQVTGVLAEIITNAEQRNVGGILDHISDTFSGTSGSKRSLQALLETRLHRTAWTHIITFDETFTESGDAVTVDLIVALLKASTRSDVKIQDLQKHAFGVYDVAATFTREGGRWLVTEARWSRTRLIQ